MDIKLRGFDHYHSIFFGGVVCVGLYLTSRYNYVLFHSLAEIFSIVVACGMFVIVWNARQFMDHPYLQFLGVAYLFIGGLDGVHTLAYKGLLIFPGYDANLPTQLWIAARYLESLSLLVAPVFFTCKLRTKTIVASYSGIVIALLAATFARIFPDCLVEGIGLTSFKILSEYVICGLLIAAIVTLHHKRQTFDPLVLRLVTASLVVTIGSELAFTRYISVYGPANLIGHLLKILSFYLLYKAIIETGLRQPYRLLFRDLTQQNERLECMNTQLQQEITDRKMAEEALRQAHAGLEHRVVERTAELRAANEQLQIELAERAQAEAALRESEEKYRTLIQKIQAAVVVHGSDTGILTCNSIAQALLGLSEAQLLGTTVLDPAWHFLREDGTVMPVAEYPVNQVFATRQPLKDLVAGIHRPDQDDEVWVLVNADPVFGKEDDITQVIVTFINITERKQAEEALRENEERFRFVLNNSLDAAYRRNLQTDRYDYMSPVIEHVLGWSVEDMNRMDIQTVLAHIHPEDVPMIMQEIERTNALCQATGRATGMLEYRIRNKHGEYRWVGDTITVLADVEGRPLYRLGIVRDITERKRAEEEIRRLNQELEQRVLERTAQLEVANKELEAFAYSVSHDLRAPLRHIDGFLELLQKRAATALDEQSRHYMDTISASAKHMGALIDDLLSFSRMGRADMAARPVELASLVQEVIRELEPETRGRIIHWQIAALPVVIGDRAMLRVVLVNLLGNAVKFTRPRARAEIEIGCRPDQGEVMVFVRDNGVGFDPTYTGKLFGVFQRLHHADEFEGTGIGLANVRRIITRHGGRTWAEGTVDYGAVFYFSLPQR